MDSVTLADKGDWAERKELEKNERYGMHLYFINYLSTLNGRHWNCSQANLLSREDPFPRQTLPSRGDELQSQTPQSER